MDIFYLSAFDLDNTLIRGNTSYQFCYYLYQKKLFSISSLVYAAWCYILYQTGFFSLHDLHLKIFQRLLKGRKLEILDKYAESFIYESFPKTLYLPAFFCLRQAQHLGHHTMILSNSPNFLVRHAANYLGINEWKATEYAVDKDQTLCHITKIMEGESKAICIEEMIKTHGIQKKNITIYSDSYLDLPFLLAAGQPVAVNPDKKLTRLSQKNHWKML